MNECTDRQTDRDRERGERERQGEGILECTDRRIDREREERERQGEGILFYFVIADAATFTHVAFKLTGQGRWDN